MKTKNVRKFGGVELELFSSLNVDLEELKQRANYFKKKGLINRFRIIPKLASNKIQKHGFAFIYDLYAERLKEYDFLFEDTGRTHNINMHSFSCLAFNKEEAMEKIKSCRPELANRLILSITQDGNKIYEDPEFRTAVNSALAQINAKN